MKTSTSVTLLASFWLAAVVPTVVQAAQYRDLCASVPSACEPTGPEAPVFDADVCWNESGALTLKGAGACAGGSWAYHLKYGEVIDPVNGTIVAYRPLDNACDHPGLCVKGEVPPGTSAQSICCEWGFCVPLNEVLCNSPASFAVMCYEGVTNQDGSVTCYEGDLYPD